MQKKIFIFTCIFVFMLMLVPSSSACAADSINELCVNACKAIEQNEQINSKISSGFKYAVGYSYVNNCVELILTNDGTRLMYKNNDGFYICNNYNDYIYGYKYKFNNGVWECITTNGKVGLMGDSSNYPLVIASSFESVGNVSGFTSIPTLNEYLQNIITPTPIPEDELNKNLGMEIIDSNGFRYNGIYYQWNSSQKAYMILENLTDYLVFYDDYNKQLIFVWAFDDFMAQAKNQKSGLRFYSYYYEFITDPNNSSVLPYCYSIYQINTDGTLECINSLQNEKAENNHQFSFGWTNPIYEPQLDNIDNFSTYEEYVLNNNLIASNCDIYNNSGVLVKSAVTLNNELITPDEVPETEIGALKYYLYEKLPIIRTVEVFVKKFNVVLESMKESGEPPEIIMNFDNYYGFGGQVNVLDVSWYEDYREPVKAILSAILIIPFILWVYKKGLPEAIGGI